MRKILLMAGVALTSLTAAPLPAAPKEEIPKPAKLTVANPGFEEGLARWNVTPKYKEQIEVATEKPHEGKNSLKIDSGETPNDPFVGQSVPGLEGAATYRLSAQARGVAWQGTATAALKLEYYNAAGKNTSGYYTRQKLKSDGSWTPLSVTARADADTTRVSVLLRVFGSGTVYLDDVTLEKVKDAPDIAVTQSAFQAVPAGEAAQISLDVWLKKPWTNETPPPFTLEVTAKEADAKEADAKPAQVAAQVQKKDAQNFTLSAQLPPVAGADQEITVRLGELRSVQPARVFAILPNRRPRYLTENGTILHNGKPFFPIGMYHPYRIETDYPLLAENGFNAVQGTATANLEEFKKSLDLAQKYGLAVDVPFYGGGKVKGNLSNSLEKIRRFADHPAVLCWKIIDEPDIQSNTEVSAEVPEAYRAFKAADPNHPIELTLAHDATLPFWAKFCDIVQIDRYPVPQRPLTAVSDFSRNAVAAMEPWQNLTFVVQSGWVQDLSNQPTAAQARSMVYLALTSGAKGIFWYSMREGSGWDLTQTPFWPQMKAINEEIKTLSQPIMLGEDVPGITCSDPKVHFLGKKFDGKLYLLVTNPEDAATTATFTLPAGADALSATQLGSTQKVNVKNSQLVLKLDAVDSRTLVVE